MSSWVCSFVDLDRELQKSYKIQHQPSWWPDGSSFVTFTRLTHASRADNDRILEAMYAFNVKGIRSYHSKSDSLMKK